MRVRVSPPAPESGNTSSCQAAKGRAPFGTFGLFVWDRFSYLIRESIGSDGLLGGASGSPTAWPAGEIPWLLISCSSEPGCDGGGSLPARECPRNPTAAPMTTPIRVSTTVHIMRLGECARNM